MRIRLATAAVCLVALVLPAQALAGTASKSGGIVTVSASAGQTNHLAVTVVLTNLRITETGSGASLTAATGCSPDGTNQVLCPLAGTTLIAMTGNDGDDWLTNSTSIPGNLNGGADEDVLTGGTGADTLTGSTGLDYVTYTSRSAPVTASLDGLGGDGQFGENDTIASDVETLVGGSGADTLTGNSLDNGLDGGPGADTLNGGAGNDFALYWTRTAAVSVTLDGVANDGEPGENDAIGADVESAIGGDGDDTLVGGPGDNDLWGWDGNDTIDGGAGDDDLGGLNGIDTITYATHTAPVTVTLDGAAGDGAAGENDNATAENVIGGSGGDTLTGSSGVNSLDGGPGADVLDGGLGADALAGGTGTDRLSYALRTGPVTADIDGTADDGEAAEGDNVATDVENLTGGAGADTLTGDADANLLDGGTGADALNGGGGTDTVTYASRTAPVTADIDGNADDGQAAEGDKIATDVENLTGGAGADTLTGSAGVNRLDGAAAADTLNGGDGEDVLIGAGGADGFLARDGADDQMSCGSEPDTVTADPDDDADADCEDVDTGETAPVLPAKPKAKATSKAKASKVRISARPITLGRDGTAPVRIACPKTQVRGCAGTVTIDVAAATARKGKAKSSRRSRRRTTLGKKKFKVAAGKKKTIRVRLSRRGRRRVLRKRRIRCRVSVSNRGQNGKTVTTKLNVSLKAPKPKAGK